MLKVEFLINFSVCVHMHQILSPNKTWGGGLTLTTFTTFSQITTNPVVYGTANLLHLVLIMKCIMSMISELNGKKT